MSDLKIGIPDFASGALSDARLKTSLNNMQNLSTKLNGLKEQAKPDENATQDAARQFEGLLIQQMLKSMWSTVPQDGMLTGGKEEQMFRDMLNQAYADEMSKGQGIGIKQLVAGELAGKK